MAAPSDDSSAYLELADGRRVALDRPQLTLGRSSASDVILADERVSRRHAQIRRLPQGWLLLDLGSSNGTQVNGYPVTLPHLLQDGDEITLGAQRLIFRSGGPPPPPAARKRQQAETVLGRSAFGPEMPPPPPPSETPTGEQRLGF
ncbi:MAG TPA: FHA domain-containing protein [Chloroflexota bacterium]|nr:FHA domain-containing protein [Chloroflexota bacterium]